MKKIKKIKTAFSLIELSIVVLVIGILIAGVVQGSKLYDKFKIQTATQLTRSSPVNSVKDLVLWYETSLEESFSNSSGAIVRNITDGTSIDRWNDINPQKTLKLNATASGSARPTFREKIINGLSGVYFDGSSDSMTFDGTWLAGSPYTIFIVANRNNADNVNPQGIFVGAISNSTNTSIGLLHDDTNLGIAHWGYNLSTSTSSIGSIGTSRASNFYTFMLNTKVGKKIWFNGITNQTTAQNSQNLPLTSSPNVRLGQRSTGMLRGYLLEVIMFNRALNNEERLSIEKYLSQKYNIPIA